MDLFLILLLSLTTYVCNCTTYSRVRFYANMAEVNQPLEALPVEFTSEEWSQYIRADSISLVGASVNITSMTITEKKKSLDGTSIYVRSPIPSSEGAPKFVKGILLDETSNLVKILDESIGDKELFLKNVPTHDILYLEKPLNSKFHVKFTYEASKDDNIDISYLRSDLHWQTRYQLNLFDDTSVLIAIAEIRNDGQSMVSINHAELIGGDINLKSSMFSRRRFMTSNEFSTNSDSMFLSESASESFSPLTIEQGEESEGVYVFNVEKPFSIDARTTFLLPMRRPQVNVERFALILNDFSKFSNTGKAQRSYRIKPDRFLTRGT